MGYKLTQRQSIRINDYFTLNPFSGLALNDLINADQY